MDGGLGGLAGAVGGLCGTLLLLLWGGGCCPTMVGDDHLRWRLWSLSPPGGLPLLCSTRPCACGPPTGADLLFCAPSHQLRCLAELNELHLSGGQAPLCPQVASVTMVCHRCIQFLGGGVDDALVGFLPGAQRRVRLDVPLSLPDCANEGCPSFLGGCPDHQALLLCLSSYFTAASEQHRLLWNQLLHRFSPLFLVPLPHPIPAWALLGVGHENPTRLVRRLSLLPVFTLFLDHLPARRGLCRVLCTFLPLRWGYQLFRALLGGPRPGGCAYYYFLDRNYIPGSSSSQRSSGLLALVSPFLGFLSLLGSHHASQDLLR